jgi:hypothetical protein
MKQLSLDLPLEEPQTGLVVVLPEQDQEGQALLGELLGVLERDLTHQRRALFVRPRVQLVVLGQVTRLVQLLGALHRRQIPECNAFMWILTNRLQITSKRPK